MEKNILLTIEYDGTAFSGWQRQPSVRTVQGELERVLTDLCGMQDGKPIELSGTSRTDAGVHALGQRASFKGEFGIPAERIPLAASHMLASGRGGKCACGDVRITAAEEMPPEFHARFNSVGKTYRYIIKHGTEPRVFERNYCYHIKQHLSAENMRKAAAEIVGTHDFACFQAAGGTPRETTVRTVFGLHIIEVSENELHIEITGDGFLYNMVRIIAGTLCEVGQGKRKPDEITQIIKSKDRRKAGHTAPPQGLYLVEIYYDSARMKAAAQMEDASGNTETEV